MNILFECVMVVFPPYRKLQYVYDKAFWVATAYPYSDVNAPGS